jgi:hypothetical protein
MAWYGMIWRAGGWGVGGQGHWHHSSFPSEPLPSAFAHTHTPFLSLSLSLSRVLSLFLSLSLALSLQYISPSPIYLSLQYISAGSNPYSEQKHWVPTMTALYVDDLACVSTSASTTSTTSPTGAGADAAGGCTTVVVEMDMPGAAV